MSSATFLWLSLLALANVFMTSLSSNTQTRELDKIGGDEVFRREIGNIKEPRKVVEYPRDDPTIVGPNYPSGPDPFGEGNTLRADEFAREVLLRSLERLAADEHLENAEEYRERGLFALLDRLTGGEISRSLNNVDTSDFLMAMGQAGGEDGYRHKRAALDSIAGVTFGEMKRMVPKTVFSKRQEFDEIDNVGFNNWAKKPYEPKDKKASERMQSLALARRNFGSPRRFRLLSLAKKNFDEFGKSNFGFAAGKKN